MLLQEAIGKDTSREIIQRKSTTRKSDREMKRRRNITKLGKNPFGARKDCIMHVTRGRRIQREKSSFKKE